jgi:hypothetical protein
MRTVAAGFAALALAALAACGSPTPTATPYTNADWGFAATFPGAPKVTETPKSATSAHSLLVQASVGDEDMAINVIDATDAEGMPSEILDRAQQVIGKDQDLDVGSNTPVQLNGGSITGREVRFDKDGKPVMLSRLYMINGHLYELNANSAKGVGDPWVKQFLDSFHLVASPQIGEPPAAPTNAPSNAAPANAAGH